MSLSKQRKTQVAYAKPAEIPLLDEEGLNYEMWRIRITSWVKVSPEKKSKLATLIFVSLPHKAFMAARHIDGDIMESAGGVKALLEKLDEIYLPDKLRHRLDVFEQFCGLIRKEGESVIEHINEFNNRFLEFSQFSEGIAYNDSTKALQLLQSCKLNEDDKKLVVSKMKEPPSFTDVCDLLKRIFSKTEKEKETTDETLKYQSQESDTDNLNATLMSRDNRRKYGQSSQPYDKNAREAVRNRPDYWDRNDRDDRETQRRRTHSGDRDADYQRKNVKRRDGSYQKCAVCDSIYHFYRDCPEVKKMKKEYQMKKEQEVNLSF